MRRYLRFLIALFGLSGAAVALAQTPLPITGNLTQLLGTPSAYASIQLQLYNCPSPATIPGNSVIVQSQVELQANSAGLINGTVWANDQIDCNGTTGASMYAMVPIVDGLPSGTQQCYQVLSTQTVWNLNIQQPITCSSSAPDPTDITATNLFVTNNFSANNGLFYGTVEAENGVSNTVGLLLTSEAQGWTGIAAGYVSHVPGKEAFGLNTLSSGTVTINSAVACTPSASCVYKITNCGKNASTAIGTLGVTASVPGVSFTISSLGPTGLLLIGDLSSFCWQIN